MSSSGKKRIYVFIDEIQNFPVIIRIMKYLIDHYHVKFIVTGSSNFYLNNLFPESLSGRKFLYNLKPLSFGEYLYFNDKLMSDNPVTFEINLSINKQNKIDALNYKEDYNSFLEFGGFPEVVLTDYKETKMLILRNIFSSFFKKDLQLVSDLKDIKELRDLILLLEPLVGSVIDVTKLSKEIGTNRIKIYNYLEYPQGTFFVHLLNKYSKSIYGSIAGGRKIYFSDSGILNMIGKVNDGQLFENAVINQLKNYGDLSFYNKQNRAEQKLMLF